MSAGLRPAQVLLPLFPRRGLPGCNGGRGNFRNRRDVAKFDIGGGADARTFDRAHVGEAHKTLVFDRPIDAVARRAKLDRRAIGIAGVAKEHAAMRRRDEHGALDIGFLLSVRMVDHVSLQAPEDPRGAGTHEKFWLADNLGVDRERRARVGLAFAFNKKIGVALGAFGAAG